MEHYYTDEPPWLKMHRDCKTVKHVYGHVNNDESPSIKLIFRIQICPVHNSAFWTDLEDEKIQGLKHIMEMLWMAKKLNVWVLP